MMIIPLPRKRLRFCIEEKFHDGTRMVVASIDVDPRGSLRLLSYLADAME